MVVALGLAAAPVAGATPSNPLLAGSVSSATSLSGATAVAVSGQYAYTTAYFAGELTAINLSNPAAPVIAGSSAFSTTLENASTVNIVGGYAYVASKNRNNTCLPGPAPNNCGSGSNDDGSGNSLTILDISTNPAVPQIVGSVQDATKLFGAYGVAVSGNYAYLAAQGCLTGQPCPNPTAGNSFEVVDISNPASPQIVGSLANSALPAPWTGTNALQHACSVAVSGHYAYVTAAYSNRLTVIDISNPAAPTIVASPQDNNRLTFDVDVAVKGNYAYVADQTQNPSFEGTIAVVDVSDPTNPQIVSTITNSPALGGAYRIRLRGNFAYVSAVYMATVSALDISNPLSPRLVGSVTSTADLNRTTGLDLDSTSTYAIASSPLLSTETQPNYPPYTGPLTGSVSAIQLDPSPIGVSITPASEPANPTTQTSAGFSFSPTDAISSVACSLDGAPFGICTSPTTQQYAGLAAGAHTFRVQATDAAGNTASASYAWTVEQAPANTGLPAISGTASQGSRLTASTGTWTGVPAPAFSYRWTDCDSGGANCRTISGATGSTYTLAASDVGATLRVAVVGSNSAGFGQAISPATGVVTSVHVTPTPVITHLRQSAKTWRESAKPVHQVAGQPKPKRLPTGTTFSFTLNLPASVSFRFTLKTSGRKAGGRCRTQTSQNRHRPRCALKVSEGTLVMSSRQGADKLSFTGRLHGKKLPAGTYSVAITATAAGKSSKTATLNFTIAP